MANLDDHLAERQVAALHAAIDLSALFKCILVHIVSDVLVASLVHLLPSFVDGSVGDLNLKHSETVGKYFARLSAEH